MLTSLSEDYNYPQWKRIQKYARFLLHFFFIIASRSTALAHVSFHLLLVLEHKAASVSRFIHFLNQKKRFRLRQVSMCDFLFTRDTVKCSQAFIFINVFSGAVITFIIIVSLHHCYYLRRPSLLFFTIIIIIVVVVIVIVVHIIIYHSQVECLHTAAVFNHNYAFKSTRFLN